MIKYAYYRDGLLPDYIVREKIEDDKLTAEAWDFKNKKWVPDANAWETIDDQRGNWALDKDYVEEYIQKMLDRFPYIKDWSIKAKSDGAVRER